MRVRMALVSPFLVPEELAFRSSLGMAAQFTGTRGRSLR
jgi:hypothetical protein